MPFSMRTALHTHPIDIYGIAVRQGDEPDLSNLGWYRAIWEPEAIGDENGEICLGYWDTGHDDWVIVEPKAWDFCRSPPDAAAVEDFDDAGTGTG